MGRVFIHYWTPRTVREVQAAGGLLDHTNSRNFASVSEGDRVWIFTCRGNSLLALGSITVHRKVGPREARKYLGYSVDGSSPFHVLAAKRRRASMKEVDITYLAPRLRFHGAVDRLPDEFSGSNFQMVRELTAESAKMVDEAYSAEARSNGHRLRSVGERSLRFEVCSTRHPGGAVTSFDARVLAQALSPVRFVRIATAFYDLDAVEEVLDRRASRPRRKVRLLLNGLGGDRLATQKSELLDFVSRRQSRGDDLEIRLVFEPGMFHTKLYMGDQDGRIDAWLGSANATSAALRHRINEELMVRIAGGAEGLIDYFDRIFQSPASIAIEDVDDDMPARSLIGFFRAGSLFFKPQVSLQKGFNPFGPLMKAITPEERSRFATRVADFADSAAGIGPFNLDHALRGQRQAPGAMEASGDEEDTASKASIRPFALETCLGYWVPAAYVPLAREKISLAGSKRRTTNDALLAALEALGRAEMRNRYERYLESAREILKELKIEWAAALAKRANEEGAFAGIVADPFDSVGAFDAFFSRLMDNLRNHGDRLSSPFLEAEMPEIWSDPVATTAFTDSAFQFLEFVSQKEKKARVARTILDACEVTTGDGWESIQVRLARLLSARGWRRSDWPSRGREE